MLLRAITSRIHLQGGTFKGALVYDLNNLFLKSRNLIDRGLYNRVPALVFLHQSLIPSSPVFCPSLSLFYPHLQHGRLPIPLHYLCGSLALLAVGTRCRSV